MGKKYVFRKPRPQQSKWLVLQARYADLLSFLWSPKLSIRGSSLFSYVLRLLSRTLLAGQGPVSWKGMHHSDCGLAPSNQQLLCSRWIAILLLKDEMWRLRGLPEKVVICCLPRGCIVREAMRRLGHDPISGRRNSTELSHRRHRSHGRVRNRHGRGLLPTRSMPLVFVRLS